MKGLRARGGGGGGGGGRSIVEWAGLEDFGRVGGRYT